MIKKDCRKDIPMETKKQTTRLVAVMLIGVLAVLGIWANRAGMVRFNRNRASDVFENHHFAYVTVARDDQAGL